MADDDSSNSTIESLRRGANDGIRGAVGIIIKWALVAVVVIVVLIFSWNYISDFFGNMSFMPDWFGWPDWLTWGNDEATAVEAAMSDAAETVVPAEAAPEAAFTCNGWWSPFDKVCIGDGKWGRD